MQGEQEFYVNPITGKKDIEQVFKESEAKEKGYLDLEFLMKYLEDENEFSKYLIVDGKKILIDMKNPMTQYKKKTIMDYERVLQTTEEKKQDSKSPTVLSNAFCNLDTVNDCIACGS